MAKPVAIVGVSGYVGGELVRLLRDHPAVEIAHVAAGRSAGARLDQVFPQLIDVESLPVHAFDVDEVARSAELAFTALPHGTSAGVVAQLRERGLAVVDLSADYRLRDPADYDRWYGSGDGAGHPHPEHLRAAVYGLPEFHRSELAAAQLAAAPGCYPTSAILAVGPLVAARLVSASTLIVDSKSGASGAGRSPALATHLPEVGEGIRAYKVAGDHRHTAEMEQELGRLSGGPVRVAFTPHLVPMSRGILTCVYAEATDVSRGEQDYVDALQAAYRDEPFVSVLTDRVPDTAFVRGSNRAHVAVRVDRRTGRVLCLSAIDNLVKGAAGQAVQCMNVMSGLAETLGLSHSPLFP